MNTTRLLLLFLLMLGHLSSVAQKETDNTYVIITVEIKNNGKLHKNQNDYWIISRNLWKKRSKQELIPLYLYGFSKTDYDECCTNKNLILFNRSTNESFNFVEGFETEQEELMTIIKKNRKNIQKIKKRWATGQRTTINIYITPIKGKFCYCKMSHNKNYNLEYKNVAVPVRDFSYTKSFWSSQEANEIKQFDYSKLPLISLHMTH